MRFSGSITSVGASTLVPAAAPAANVASPSGITPSLPSTATSAATQLAPSPLADCSSCSAITAFTPAASDMSLIRARLSSVSKDSSASATLSFAAAASDPMHASNATGARARPCAAISSTMDDSSPSCSSTAVDELVSVAAAVAVAWAASTDTVRKPGIRLLSCCRPAEYSPLSGPLDSVSCTLATTLATSASAEPLTNLRSTPIRGLATPGSASTDSTTSMTSPLTALANLRRASSMRALDCSTSAFSSAPILEGEQIARADCPSVSSASSNETTTSASCDLVLSRTASTVPSSARSMDSKLCCVCTSCCSASMNKHTSCCLSSTYALAILSDSTSGVLSSSINSAVSSRRASSDAESR
mmetsp:Transcript_28054/g.90584  ORF Transcript_28054/g.90584 Transcript_28054/m.90584 type:complete len:360 (+) Transcript_28054:2284-3363(+)